MTKKEHGLQEKPVVYWVSMHTPLEYHVLNECFSLGKQPVAMVTWCHSGYCDDCTETLSKNMQLFINRSLWTGSSPLLNRIAMIQ